MLYLRADGESQAGGRVEVGGAGVDPRLELLHVRHHNGQGAVPGEAVVLADHPAKLPVAGHVAGHHAAPVQLRTGR